MFEVCDLGKSNLIIGYTRLHKHNPKINWETGKVEMTKCPRECNVAKRRQKVLAYVICHMINIVHVITILMALETSSDKQINICELG